MNVSNPIEMIDHDAGIFIDQHGVEYPVVCYLNSDGEQCPREQGEFAMAGVEGCWFELDLSEFSLSKKEICQ